MMGANLRGVLAGVFCQPWSPEESGLGSKVFQFLAADHDKRTGEGKVQMQRRRNRA